MRKQNSEFVTKYISEPGSSKRNKEYFGFVELDKYTCFVVADSVDNSINDYSAKLVVDSIISDFTNKPTMSKTKLKRYVKTANDQLKAQRKNYKLMASVLIVVSDYQKLRYVSCGNTSLSIFRGSNLFLRSMEQSVYRHMVDENLTHNESEVGLLESKNLYQYLGKDGVIKPKISKKIKLQQEDVLLMSTWGFWHKVSDVEVLDALDGATDTNTFLGNAQDLFLSKQTGEVGSYSVITTFINKLYVDKSNKKKYIKIAVIVTVVLLIILAVLLFFNYRNNKKREETIDLITKYEQKADTYLEDENYQRAFDQYTKAVEEGEKLKSKSGKKGTENTEIKDRLDVKERVSSLILDGDALYKDKDYSSAKNTYDNALSEINANYEVFEDMDVDITELEEKMDKCDDEIYLQKLVDMGTAEKDLEQYDEAVATLEQAKQLALDLGNKDSQKEIDLLLKEISSQVKADEKAKADEEKAKAEEEKAAEDEAKAEEEKAKEEADKQAEEAKTAAEEAEAKRVENRTKEADEIVIAGEAAAADGKYDVAMDSYNSAMAIYRELKDTENMSRVQKLISELKIAEADSKNKTKYVTGDNHITAGDNHLAKNEFDLARASYNEALKIFTELQDKDYMVICRNKLADVDSAEAKIANDLLVTKADGYVKKADEYLEKSDYKNAKKYYKLAQTTYQSAGNIDKVLEMDKKIKVVEDLE